MKSRILKIQGELNEIYNFDHNLRFRASNLLLTILAANTVIISLLLMFAAAGSDVIDPLTRTVFVTLFLFLALLFVHCYHLVLEGRLSLARAVVQTTATLAVIGAITMTGGFPNSMGSVAIFIPVIMSYCLYGGRTSHVSAILLLTILASQWVLSGLFGVTFPNFASTSAPTINIAIAIIATFIIVWFALLIFDVSSREYIKRADAAMISKTNFLANTSHEIRTPMNGIIGLSEVMMRTTDLDQDQVIYMKAIHQSGTALMSVINDILDYSRLDAGHVELSAEPFNLYMLMHEIRSLLTIKAAEKNVVIKCEYPNDIPQKFIGDGGRIRQIIINLVANAVKFTQDGHVNIRPSVTMNDHFATIRIDIEDTGIGIPQHKLSTIFERFTQADSGTTQKYGGTGLGLSISQRLVELMGGRIGVSSQEHVGSTFWFELTLPLADTEMVTAGSSDHQHKEAVSPETSTKVAANTQTLKAKPSQADTGNIHQLPARNAQRILIASRNAQLIETYGSKLRQDGLRVFHTDSLHDIQKWTGQTIGSDHMLPFILVDGKLPAEEISQIISVIEAENANLQIAGICAPGQMNNSALAKLSLKISSPQELPSILRHPHLASI